MTQDLNEESSEQLDDQVISDSPTDATQLQQDLEAAIARSDEHLNGWKRTQADFDNYRKRTESEKKELLEFAKEVTVAKLLPTLDTLQQALKHIPVYSVERTADSGEQQDAALPLSEGESVAQRGEGVGANDFAKQYQNWRTGIAGLVMQLDKTLEELGVKRIEAVGKMFDPNMHEAVREVQSDQEDGIVVEELQSGFELNGKVIRPSQVVISKKQ